MDGTKLHQKIYRGRGKAAAHLGLPCDVYRPQNATAPLTRLVARIDVALNAADQRYLAPNLYGKPVWFADCDGTQICPGDYLVRSDGKIWFIAAMQQLLPIVAIDCNARVCIRREGKVSTSFGASPYSSVANSPYTAGTPDSPWPASILVGGRALAANGLPADVKESGWRILLPPSVHLTLQAGDRLDDAANRKFWTESAEQTDLGWRLTTNEAHA